MNPRLDHALKHCERRRFERFKEENPDAKFIYLVECQGFYKVGIADDVKFRISSFQVGCPFEIRLIKSWRSLNARREEKQIHHLLRQYNVKGEWFKLPEKLVAHLLLR